MKKTFQRIQWYKKLIKKVKNKLITGCQSQYLYAKDTEKWRKHVHMANN